MTERIRDLRSRHLVDYLDSGIYDKVLIIFRHGLGDAVMFRPVYETIVARYPDIHFDLKLQGGQGELWPTVENEEGYDIIFEVAFFCSEWSHREYTKGEWCCINEIGIPPVSTKYTLNRCFKSPLVGMHFFSTCNRNLNCSETVARRIHDRIIEEGLIPLDTDLKHRWHNSQNIRYSWNNPAIDNTKASAANLAGVLQRCCGFVGVPSGNWVLATALLPPERILFLEGSFPASSSVRHPVLSMRKDVFDEGIMRTWISNIKKEED